MSSTVPKIVEFTMGKGRTNRPTETEEWTRKYLELTVRMPDTFTEKDLQETMLRAEYIIDNWLGSSETSQPQIPNFDSEDLMKHKYKGKKTGEKQWSEGSLSWGWDFTEAFKPETIKVLEHGPLDISEYQFKLNDSGTIVSVSARKKSRKVGM